MLSGCASIVSGGSQSFTVDSTPEGAHCRVTRGSLLIGDIPSTPGTVRVSRGSNGLDVACTKPGYQIAQAAQPTNVNGWLFGNLFIGGLLGVVIDFSTGAAYRYDSGTELAMEPLPNAPAVSYGTPLPSRYGSWQAAADNSRAADPLVVPPATPEGDITYRWSNRGSD